MASPCHQDGPRPLFAPEAPHFFKVILQNTLENGKVAIPKKFVTKYGKDLSSKVLLTLPTGMEWEVGVTRSNENIWLDHGWQIFSKFYSIKYGSFLVFRYEGNSRFYVIIFDNTASEIDYSLSNGQFDKQNLMASQMNQLEGIDDDASIEILGDSDKISACSKHDNRGKTSFSSGKGKTSELEGIGDDVSDDGREGKSSFWPEKRRRTCGNSERHKICRSEDKYCSKVEFKEHGASTSKSKRKFKFEDGIADIATAVQDIHPPFAIKMQPSYAKGGHYMWLPSWFVNRYVQESSDFILMNADGKRWTVKCHFMADANRSKNARLTLGWSAFSTDNNLSTGDICHFELIRITPISLKVTIFKRNDKGIGS